MNAITKTLYRARTWLNQAAAVTLGTMRHPSGVGGWLLLNRTNINYSREVSPDANSIIIACVRWVQRVFSEAPMLLQEWLEERGEWEEIHRDDILDLLERPNPFYNGTSLWKATVADIMLNGTAYWLKVRSASGRVVQLWWAPSATVTPKHDPTDPTVFITHFEYSPNSVPMPLRVEDVIQVRDGIDPANPRKGLSPIRALLREVFTDDEAANMTASLLRNMGVPGVVIAPKGGTIGQEAAERIKEGFMDKFSGDRKGEVLVLEGDSTVQQFGFSPDQMKMRDLRGIPEERITAVLGVNAAVVGLGAGLASTKVGATLREYREEAFESTIIPMYREMASELTHQLLRDFRDTSRFRLTFDLSKVRVLQEDELKRAERLTNMVTQGLLKVSEGRRAMGWSVEPEHEIYLRPVNLNTVPVGDGEMAPGQEGNQPAQPEQVDVARLALNGAQVTALLSIIEQVTSKQLAPEVAKAVLKAAFPTLSDSEINTMVDGAAGFEVPDPEPTEPEATALGRFMASSDLFRVPTTLVAGPPGSGRTSYVMERAERGDLIIDVDKLFVALSGLRSHDHPDELLPFVLSARDASEDKLSLSSGVRHAWIIKGAPRKAQRQDMARRGAAVVVLDVAADECLERIANDPERQGVDCPWEDWINQWWEDYEPDDSEHDNAMVAAGFNNGHSRVGV